jgi:hypothetical protein
MKKKKQKPDGSPDPFPPTPRHKFPRHTLTRLRKILRSSPSLPTGALLLLLDFEEKSAVDVREHAAKGDGGADEGVEFLVAADGELEVAGGDAFHF